MIYSQHLISHFPYLSALAREKSFTKAAEFLHVTQAAVSYQIKELERKLGCRLVIRQSGSQIRFTADGEKLVKEYQYCEQRLDWAVRGLDHNEGKGILRLSTPIDLGSIIMPKVLSALKKEAPDLRIELNSSDTNVNLDHDKWDIAVRSHLVSVEHALFTSPIYLLASPSYLQKHPVLNLDSLEEHTLILRENSNNRTWEKLIEKQGNVNERFENILTLGTSIGMREAAVEGLGITLLAEFVAKKEIEAGSLVKILVDKTNGLVVSFTTEKIDAPQAESYEQLLNKVFEQFAS
jgi:DNA-binding transcriptional LysR family regulator